MSRYCLSWIAEQVFPAYYPNFTFRVSRLKKRREKVVKNNRFLKKVKV